jgi:flagellar protein FliS
MATATQSYEQASISTQNKGRVIVMLYEGTIKFLKQATDAMEKGDLESKGKFIVKAQDIIFELNSVLDIDNGGEVAQNLRKLYNFMWQRLSEASIKQDAGMVREVISLLEELNRGWKAIA